MLLRSLDAELAQEGLRGRVLLVDDGSKTPYQSRLEGLVLERGAIERRAAPSPEFGASTRHRRGAVPRRRVRGCQHHHL